MRWILLLLYIFVPAVLYAQLIINEIACNVSKSDWVELFLSSNQPLSMDISSLYVTMYYGTNEPLSQNPVTIVSYDRAETPWDDRFIVVHLTDPVTVDECDKTGDTNGNGVLDVYCNNYSSSLWNTDCVVAIDTDDDPANGGIIDFVAYSNRDGTLNQSIRQYMAHALQHGQWAGIASEEYMVDIGKSGLLEYQSIIRHKATDLNSLNDFVLTQYQTPGRPNILPVSHAEDDFIKLNTTMTFIKGAVAPFTVFILQPCSFRIRLFSSIGHKVYESPLIMASPGFFNLDWAKHIKRIRCGLYLGTVEAQNSKDRQRVEFYCIVAE
ncbi:MAG: hypothetical protein N3F66_06670 [Spirochaetes bacterium]|nr:hypothetical protein [Spirochaetota bacterium]